MFGIGDYETYLKLPVSKGVLQAGKAALLALSTRSSALYRNVLTEYSSIFSALAENKPRGIKERLVKVQKYRDIVLKRTTEVADYMNWFEATQMRTQSTAFDNYLETARQLMKPGQREDPITKFVDEMAAQADRDAGVPGARPPLNATR